MPFSETVKYIEMKKEKNKTYFRHFIIERKLDGPTHPIYIYIYTIQNGKTFEIAGHRYELSWSVSPLSTRFFLYDFFVASWTAPAHRRKVNHEASEWKASSEKWRVCPGVEWRFESFCLQLLAPIFTSPTRPPRLTIESS